MSPQTGGRVAGALRLVEAPVGARRSILATISAVSPDGSGASALRSAPATAAARCSFRLRTAHATDFTPQLLV